MFLVGLLGWWYGNGWHTRVQKTWQHIDSTVAFFSIGQLAKTLFSPFRQISAGSVRGPIGAQLRAFVDKLISRVIGSIVRTLTILMGIIFIAFVALYWMIVLVLWLLLPLAPIFGMILAVIGLTPSWL